MKDNTLVVRFERAMLRLEILTERVERALERIDGVLEPEVDQVAVKAAEKMVEARRWQILNGNGNNGSEG